MADPSFIQVAPDGGGKKMRTEIDLVTQPDGSIATTHREIVSAPPEWMESERDKYMRAIQENILLALRQMVNQLAAQSGRFSPYEDTL
jgi:hypothetical protein